MTEARTHASVRAPADSAQDDAGQERPRMPGEADRRFPLHGYAISPYLHARSLGIGYILHHLIVVSRRSRVVVGWRVGRCEINIP